MHGMVSPGKVVAVETVDELKLELDRYLESVRVKGYMNIGRIASALMGLKASSCIEVPCVRLLKR